MGDRVPAKDGLAGWWVKLPPGAGTAVMATGIVSIGLHLVGQEALSWILLVLAAIVWLALAVDFARQLLREREQWEIKAATPPALTAVAATTILGTWFALQGWSGVAVAALVVAVLVWPVLLTAVVRHWRRRLPGTVFLVCVATQGLAVLGGTLALSLPSGWLAWPALGCFLLGLALYPIAFLRFDLGQVRSGAGDQWVAGGTLAISALAGSKLMAVPAWRGTAAQDALRALTLVTLALSACWYAVLVFAEARWPRPRYDMRRWATVFPMGMTAVATLSVADAAAVGWLRTPGQVLLWIAVAAWAITLVGLVRHLATYSR
ncbi:tellurite resistance/C4-dicarboxylate transporter family protein [Streptomyces sp. NBC_01474]|uniref:tellurite resistance/C4-dicarboxylate transporter family protein n=1 Tax=unclassified Streptomyces TaxID=2593676 RepID=UPI002DD8AA50|nr:MULTISPECIES: tellurite resistance/C4-dicarboxylate transporter family protein [unclassified Streptomyces]WSD94713.1 tellurite resistance/C4-dicarboxylate transporter family protein [Streptomyces sp. NBC_01474]